MDKRFSKFCFLICCALVVAGLSAMPSYAASAKGVVKKEPGVSMMESINAALRYNPELKASQEARQLSRHAVERAKAGHMPTVGLSGGTGTSRRDDSNTRDRREENKFRGIADADLLLTLPLFHGYSITEGVELATAEFDSSERLLEDQGIATIYSAISAHTDVVRRAELVALASTNVKEHAKILDSVQNRYNTGVATTGELNQVRSRYARSKATLATYKAALDAAKATYLRVTGNQAGNLEAVVAPGLCFANLEEARKATIAANPSIQSYLAVLKAAAHEKEQTESRFYPQVDFVTGPSWSDRQSRVDSHVTDLSAEVRFSWDLFNGGADTATVRMANAKIRQARQNLHGLMNSLNEDLESTFSRYEAAAVEVKEYKAAKVASRAAREDYYRQFLAAQRSLIDVLDAENDFFYAASQEVMSTSDRVLSAYRLIAVSGDLLRELRINTDDLKVDSHTTETAVVKNLGDVPSPLVKDWDISFIRQK